MSNNQEFPDANTIQVRGYKQILIFRQAAIIISKEKSHMPKSVMTTKGNWNKTTFNKYIKENKCYLNQLDSKGTVSEKGKLFVR